MNQKDRVTNAHPHAELTATFQRAQADAAHKLGLIQTVANKGPKAIQAAVETAAKAAKRRDSFAKKLAALGVAMPQAPQPNTPAKPTADENSPLAKRH